MKSLCHLAIVALQVLPCPAEPVALIPPPRDEGNLAKVPHYLLDRCTPELRLAAIQSRGGNPAAEQAVIDALRFLKDTQDENGSWAFGRPVGMTSLALLCFLGHGETTQSEEFTESASLHLDLNRQDLRSRSPICEEGETPNFSTTLSNLKRSSFV